MKTRFLFIPDEQTFVLLESELPPGRLVCAVNEGHWSPPAPYDRMQPASKRGSETRDRLQAVCLGSQVVVYAATAAAEAQQKTEVAERPHMTRRQQQVLQGLAEGLTSKQMALRLGTTARTVSRYVADIKLLLQASTRAQIVSRAAALGLLHPEE